MNKLKKKKSFDNLPSLPHLSKHLLIFTLQTIQVTSRATLSVLAPPICIIHGPSYARLYGFYQRSIEMFVKTSVTPINKLNCLARLQLKNNTIRIILQGYYRSRFLYLA